jgi:cytochrome c oxidase cbb3-type subunit 3
MSNDRHEKPARILRFEEYRQAHIDDAARLDQPPPTVAPIDTDLQSGFRSFPPAYYEEIEAEMDRMSGIPAETPHASAQGVGDATTLATDEPIDELTEHVYDGIQEYDNPTPGWWYAIFVASILFGGFYALVYHIAVPPLTSRHATAEARHLDEQFAELNKLETGVPKILAIMNEEAWLDRGATIFNASCAICHSSDGSGLVGPNLTDETYKNITGLMDITALIINGTPNGSMPAQKNLLNDNEIALVTAYVASLRGKNLPTNPSVDPTYTGVPIAPWPTLDAAGNVVQPSAAAQHRDVSPIRLTSRHD